MLIFFFYERDLSRKIIKEIYLFEIKIMKVRKNCKLLFFLISFINIKSYLLKVFKEDFFTFFFQQNLHEKKTSN